MPVVHPHAHAHPVHVHHPVVHHKPHVVEPAPVEEPVEESVSEVSEHVEIIGEVFHGDEEDPYVDYDVVVEESESESSEHTEVDHYAAAAPEESSEHTEAEVLVQPDPSTAPKVVATKVGGRVYRPEQYSVAPVAAYRPAAIHPAAYHHHPVVAPVAPVLVHDHDSSDDEPNVTINIYNGNGATMGFGGRLECEPRVGECRPQCPEVVYNEYDNSLWFTW